MMLYIQQLQEVPWDGLKLRLSLMSRLSMASLFESLPDKHKERLREFDSNFITAISHALKGKRSEVSLDRPMINVKPGKMKLLGHEPFYDEHVEEHHRGTLDPRRHRW